MSLSESITSAADYTRRFFGRLREMLLLFILTIIPIVNIFTLGYIGRVIADRGDSKQPPKMEKYTDMFVNGLKYIGAIIVWAIPIVVVAIIAAIALIAPAAYTLSQSVAGNFSSPAYWQNFNWTNWSQMANQYPAAVNLVLAIIPTILITAIVAIIVGIFAIMGIVHMFKTGSFTKAFALGEISHIISKIGWLRYLGYIIVAVFLSIIASLFGAIPVVGWLITAFLDLLLYIFLARTIGLMYDSAVGGAAPVPQSQPPAIQMPQAQQGMPFSSSAAMQSPAAASPSPIYCTNCGAPNPPESAYCNKCGRALTK